MKEQSFGIIPIREQGKKKEFLLIKHSGGHWGFPKGHPIEGEEERESASRELKEETGLEISTFLEKEAIVEHYCFIKEGRKVNKMVTYYLALVKGDLHLDLKEVVEARWCTWKEAYELATFQECKLMIKQMKICRDSPLEPI